jgi:hypothetical protein
MRVRVGDAAGREVDAIAAEQPVAGRALGEFPDERVSLDPRGTDARPIRFDVVDDVLSRACLHARWMIRQLQDQWKVWPPSITID